MADILVRLIFNLETGKKDILIDYDGDADALPHEHEKHHRQVVETLLGQGVLKKQDIGTVTVQRGGNTTPKEETKTQPQQERKALEQS
jgi:hypothetical protein